MFFGAKSRVIASNSKQIPYMFLGIFLAHPSKNDQISTSGFYHKSTTFDGAKRKNPCSSGVVQVVTDSWTVQIFRLELRNRFRTLLPCGMLEARLGVNRIQRLTENDVPWKPERS